MANYTFAQKSAPTSTTGDDNFGGAVVDGNHQAIVGLGSGIQTSDASGTPLTSPQTVGTTATVLNIPANAAKVVITPAAATNVSEIAGSTGYTIPAGATVSIPCGRMSKLYLSTASGTSVTQFYFEVI